MRFLESLSGEAKRMKIFRNIVATLLMMDLILCLFCAWVGYKIVEQGYGQGLVAMTIFLTAALVHFIIFMFWRDYGKA